jgi:Tol biopolymer transport system component
MKSSFGHQLAYLRTIGGLIACVFLASMPLAAASQAPAATSTVYLPLIHSFRLPGKIVFSLREVNDRDRVTVYDAARFGLATLTTGSTPSWSPDGSKIAFTDIRDNPKGPNLYVMNADGSEQTKLSNSFSPIETLRWSPDGTTILFSASPDQLNFYWAIINADGSGERRLFGDQGGDDPVWSPDGTRIAFVGSENNAFEGDIYVMNADGSGRTNLSNNPRRDLTPQWSPDGTKIAFVSVLNGKPTIYVINADGSGQMPLTDGLTTSSVPAWSPDGSKIAYLAVPRPLEGSIIVMNVDGSGQRVLRTGFVGEPIWSPDSAYVAFISDLSELWAVSTNGEVQINVTAAADTNISVSHPQWRE